MARDFDGSTGYLGIGTGLSGLTTCSISMWIWPDVLTQQHFISTWNDSPYEGWGFSLSVTTADKLGWWSNNNGGSWKESAGSIVTTGWQHVGVSIAGTGAGDGKFYINGAVDATTFTPAHPSAFTGIEHKIGRRCNSAGSLAYFNGKMQDVAVWDTALSAGEWASLGKNYSPRLIRPQSRIRFWELLGNTSPETELDSGVGGTINGTVAKASHNRTIYPRRKRTIFIPAAAGGGFQSAWARGSNVILGAGAP